MLDVVETIPAAIIPYTEITLRDGEGRMLAKARVTKGEKEVMIEKMALRIDFEFLETFINQINETLEDYKYDEEYPE